MRFEGTNAYVATDDLKGLSIEISVLSPFQRIQSLDEIDPDQHGVMVKRGLRRGLFLPQVWKETGWDKVRFLTELCASKAGLSPSSWRDPQTEIWIFTAQSFEEEIAPKTN